MFLEQLKTSLAAVITLHDVLIPDGSVIGDVFVTAATREKPVKHGANRFVLVNATGICPVTYGGHFYETVETTVNLSSLDSHYPEVHFNLTPKSNYPSAILRGKVVRKSVASEPISGAAITIYNRPENATSDVDGNFSIRFDLMPTDLCITVIANKDGFQSVETSLMLKKDDFTNVIVKLSASP